LQKKNNGLSVNQKSLPTAHTHVFCNIKDINLFFSSGYLAGDLACSGTFPQKRKEEKTKSVAGIPDFTRFLQHFYRNQNHGTLGCETYAGNTGI
jgi:hypothetical protein